MHEKGVGAEGSALDAVRHDLVAVIAEGDHGVGRGCSCALDRDVRACEG